MHVSGIAEKNSITTLLSLSTINNWINPQCYKRN